MSNRTSYSEKKGQVAGVPERPRKKRHGPIHDEIIPIFRTSR